MAKEMIKSSDGKRGYMVTDSKGQYVSFSVACTCGWEMTGEWCPEYCPDCDASLTEHIPASEHTPGERSCRH
jgi:hypothetical protein